MNLWNIDIFLTRNNKLSIVNQGKHAKIQTRIRTLPPPPIRDRIFILYCPSRHREVSRRFWFIDKCVNQAIENETKGQRGGFLIVLGTLGASLLGVATEKIN